MRHPHHERLLRRLLLAVGALPLGSGVAAGCGSSDEGVASTHSGGSAGAGGGASGGTAGTGSGGAGGTAPLDGGGTGGASDAAAGSGGSGGVLPADECPVPLGIDYAEERALIEGSVCAAGTTTANAEVVCFPALAVGATCGGSYEQDCVLWGYTCGLTQRGDRIGCEVSRPGECCWVVFGDCAVGRPLLVRGAARRAAIVPGPAWTARALSPDVGALDAASRRALAAHWSAEAATEHASVASFARVTLELLALGAPTALVRRALSAGDDERRHAASALALASAYAGQALEPAPLALEGVWEGPPEAERVLLATWREGCVAETVSALLVAEAAALAEDAAVRAELARVAAEEAEHAELAWRTVAWLLGRDPARLGRVLRRELDDVHRHVSLGHAVPAGGAPEALAAHGCLPWALRNRRAHAALAGVVLPAGWALLAALPEASAPARPRRANPGRFRAEPTC